MGSRPVQPTAEYVLERLQEGNARFVRGELSHPHQDVARRDELMGGQFPFTTIFTATDYMYLKTIMSSWVWQDFTIKMENVIFHI